METVKGIGVSPGIAVGRAKVISKRTVIGTGILLVTDADIAAAVLLFENAVAAAIAEIEKILADGTGSLTDEETVILETHIEFLGDPSIIDEVKIVIAKEKKHPVDAVIKVTALLADQFAAMDDEYFRARAADIKDVGARILRQLQNDRSTNQILKNNTIIIAEDLTPSDTIALDLQYVNGFITRLGGKTSHAAIVARAKGLPAVAGCGDILAMVSDDDLIGMDGATGEIWIHPNNAVLDTLAAARISFNEQTEKLKRLKNVDAITPDGIKVELMGNISGADDLPDVFYNGGEGVGLLRTELLFMNRDAFPSEEEQFEFYKQAALKAKGKPVIVRTLDIGGDKHLPYFDLPVEQNPFLGYRAIRICLDREDLFIPQLKAILRASVFGDLKIMFPMISNIQELKAAKLFLNEAKNELAAGGTAFNAAMEVGMMIEIPSAAVTADIMAKEVDFFSIGTNDLCQYTLALDRMNEKISHLYDPFNPGVLRLIANVIEQADKHHIHVGMCGELAGDPLATQLLLGMGLRNFSMSAAAIPAIKDIIIHTPFEKARSVYKKVMEMDNSEMIKAYLQSLTT